jgi:hypothetical protein
MSILAMIIHPTRQDKKGKRSSTGPAQSIIAAGLRAAGTPTGDAAAGTRASYRSATE